MAQDIFSQFQTRHPHVIAAALSRNGQIESLMDTLGVPRTCALEDVKKAYRKAALKWHPERAPGTKAEVMAKFDAIAEAYPGVPIDTVSLRHSRCSRPYMYRHLLLVHT